MKFSCREASLSFVEEAPERIVTEALLEASAAEVFEILADPQAWPKWFESISHVEWTSEQTGCVGATRKVALKTMTVYERFLAWEPGERFTFCFTATSLPCYATRFVEDYRLEVVDAGRSRLVWTACFEARLLLRLTRGVLAPMFEEAAAGLAEYVKTRGA